LVFISRKRYDDVTASLRKASWELEYAGIDANVRRQTLEAVGDMDLHGAYILPEGAGGMLGAIGCASIIDELAAQLPGFASTAQSPGFASIPTTVVAACGTGTTMVGLATGAAAHKASNICIMGVSALKTAGSELHDALARAQLPESARDGHWSVQQGFHFGGFARYPPVLQRFVEAWEGVTGVPLDPVYTSKAALAMLAHLGTTEQLVLLHSGGLQGKRPTGTSS
jgi:1-aminocyclopropane-1-carboxylate deaminase